MVRSPPKPILGASPPVRGGARVSGPEPTAGPGLLDTRPGIRALVTQRRSGEQRRRSQKKIDSVDWMAERHLARFILDVVEQLHAALLRLLRRRPLVA
jgi:hypothetical protein